MVGEFTFRVEAIHSEMLRNGLPLFQLRVDRLGRDVDRFQELQQRGLIR